MPSRRDECPFTAGLRLPSSTPAQDRRGISTTFAAAWLAQQQNPALTAVPFDERLGLLVEAEWLARENRRLVNALREAKLRLI